MGFFRDCMALRAKGRNGTTACCLELQILHSNWFAAAIGISIRNDETYFRETASSWTGSNYGTS